MKVKKSSFLKWIWGLVLVLLVVVLVVLGVWIDRSFLIEKKVESPQQVIREVLQEENTVIGVVETVSPSVVTIGMKTTQRVIDPSSFLFSVKEEKIERDIGSGFIISEDGLVVTNKHVVSDTKAEYRAFTADDQELAVAKIYRDPVNDLAILQLDLKGATLKPVLLGDSSKLKPGQVVIAIGTALGELRSTVTTGVISGLSRGLGENLTDVIQTDAAINLGNSGGPLLNSSGEVVGVNVAMSQLGENIGFAIPINIVKKSIDDFNRTGKFSRPYLGIRYQMISKKTAVLNSVPQGAYVIEVVVDSPANKVGIKEGDIVTKINEVSLNEDSPLAEQISEYKVGEEIEIIVYSDDEEKEFKVTLEEAQL